MTTGADLRFTQKAGPNTPVNPTQPSEPGIVTMNGKDYRITVEIKVNGAWKKIDPKYLSDKNFLDIANRCEKIYQTATHEAGYKTLTVYFEQHNLQVPLKNKILGKFSDSYKKETVALTFNKVEYKTAGSDELQVFDVKTHEFNVETDAVAVNKLANEMIPVSKMIFGNKDVFLKQPAKTKTKSATEKNSDNLAAVKKTLNVQEAGSRENRCATLSIAAILLNRHNGNLQEVANEFNIPHSNVGQTDQITISNGLIELAAQTIETNENFSRPDTQDNLNEHFSSIVAALKAAGQTIVDEKDREAVVQQYANLIRQPGQMLDAPVFQALEMHGIPFITLVPSQGDLVLGSVSPTITFDAYSLDTYDLTTICFVVRDGLHYQPVMNEASNSAQQDKLRLILKNDMEMTLTQIQNLIADTTRASADKSVEFNNLVGSVVNRYPIDAKPRIVQMLKTALRTVDDNLISSTNDAFIDGATRALLSPPIPIIENV